MPIFEQMIQAADALAESQRVLGADKVAVTIQGNGYKIRIQAEYTSGICCYATPAAAKRTYPTPDER